MPAKGSKKCYYCRKYFAREDIQAHRILCRQEHVAQMNARFAAARAAEEAAMQVVDVDFSE